MRVYVPYGDEWYGYLVRRMAERPANLAFFLRSVADQGVARSDSVTQRVAVLGAGKMGEALLSGMLRGGTALGRRRRHRPPAGAGRRCCASATACRS